MHLFGHARKLTWGELSSLRKRRIANALAVSCKCLNNGFAYCARYGSGTGILVEVHSPNWVPVLLRNKESWLSGDFATVPDALVCAGIIDEREQEIVARVMLFILIFTAYSYTCGNLCEEQFERDMKDFSEFLYTTFERGKEHSMRFSDHSLIEVILCFVNRLREVVIDEPA
jgi:hypothetical protein